MERGRSLVLHRKSIYGSERNGAEKQGSFFLFHTKLFSRLIYLLQEFYVRAGAQGENNDENSLKDRRKMENNYRRSCGAVIMYSALLYLQSCFNRKPMKHYLSVRLRNLKIRKRERNILIV